MAAVKGITTVTDRPVTTLRVPLRTSEFPDAPLPCGGDVYVVLATLWGGTEITVTSPGWTKLSDGGEPGYTWASFWKTLSSGEMDVCLTGDSAGCWYAEGYFVIPETAEGPLPSHTG